MAEIAKADAGRNAGGIFRWRNAVGIACVVVLHLAALYALLSTEYGPFAITLALLAWLFANCVVLVLLPRPGIAAALSLMFALMSGCGGKQPLIPLAPSATPAAPSEPATPTADPCSWRTRTAVAGTSC